MHDVQEIRGARPGATLVRSSCRLCYNGCGVLVRLEGGRPTAVIGDPDHPLSKGRLCPRGQSALELMDHPDRLRHPLRRSGPRGSGAWERIGWDEALEAIVQGLGDVARRLGPESVVFMRGGSKGTSDDLLTRLAHVFGSPNISPTSSICYVATALASRHTYGFMAYPDMAHAPRCIVQWGFNPRTTHPPLYHEMRAALAAGARHIVVDPCAIPNGADILLRPRPGSDAALALGMARAILDEGLEDQDFVRRWTVGIRRLRAHLEDYAPERVQDLTWVPAKDIRRAARLYATVRPGCILWGNALEAGLNNYQSCRAICILRALTGNLGAPGSDVRWSGLGELLRRDPALTRPDLLPEGMGSRRIGALAGLLPDFGYVPHHLAAKAMLEDDPYPVRAAYLQGGNLLCTSADSRLMAEALSSLDFLAATDHFMTPTTALADIVLPASMYLEEDGVEQPWHWPAAFPHRRVADPGQTRGEGRICNDLMRRLGDGEHAFKDMDAFVARYLEPAGLDFERMCRLGSLYGPARPMAHEAEGFPTPSGKVELYSETLAGWGFAPLPSYIEPRPTDADLPLVLTSRKSPLFYHSCGRQIPMLRKARPEPVARLNPDTALGLGLADGDMVRIVTDQGAVVQRLRVDPHQDPRLVVAEHGWWFPELGPESGDGAFGWRRSNLNLLTDASRDCGRELGSPTLRAFPCRVEAAGDGDAAS